MDLCIDSFLLRDALEEALTLFFVTIHRLASLEPGSDKTHVTTGKNSASNSYPCPQILDNAASFAMFFKATLASEGIRL